jgi:hypothetical protein
MAVLKSEFSLGNGRLKGVSALQYDDAGSGKLSASVLLSLGSAGFSLDSQTLTNVAIGGAGYLSNTILPTKGYVDEAVASVTPGIPGDATFIDFTVADSSGYVVGNVVAIATSGDPVAADSSSEVNSNAVGVVISKPSATVVRVQVDGQVVLSTSLAAFTNGDIVWVASTAGAVTTYASIPSGEYAVQAGIVSDAAANKIVLQPRIFGQTA